VPSREGNSTACYTFREAVSALPAIERSIAAVIAAPSESEAAADGEVGDADVLR
jgi:hypothetical protein